MYGFHQIVKPVGYNKYVPIASGRADKFTENIYRYFIDWCIGRNSFISVVFFRNHIRLRENLEQRSTVS